MIPWTAADSKPLPLRHFLTRHTTATNLLSRPTSLLSLALLGVAKGHKASLVFSEPELTAWHWVTI
jgi:hypothetical protein